MADEKNGGDAPKAGEENRATGHAADTEAEPTTEDAKLDLAKSDLAKPHEPAPVLDAAIDALAWEPDPHARLALIRLIGAAAETDREAYEALRDHFKGERVTQVLMLIGRYVAADDLL